MQGKCEWASQSYKSGGVYIHGADDPIHHMYYSTLRVPYESEMSST